MSQPSFSRPDHAVRPARSWILALLIGTLLAAGGVPALAQAQADRLLVSNGTSIDVSPLPKLDFQPDRNLDEFIFGLTFAPDGRLFALRVEYPIGTQGIAEVVEVDDVGGLTTVFPVPLEEGEDPFDLSIGPDGQLYMLSVWLVNWDPIELLTRLSAFDVETGHRTAIHNLASSPRTLAPSREGLWLFSTRDTKLLHFDVLRNPGLITPGPDLGNLGVPVDADTDSTGALWIASEPGIVDPPIYSLWRFDPATGSARVADDFLTQTPVSVTIDRRCPFGATSRCLLGGRFQAEVNWRDFEDRNGTGKLAPTGSSDSALFWFFEPSNWELLVKVIDGCAENGHFWVFAAGTTNVEHTLTVRDLQTGAVFTATNPLGAASSAVTATDAFPTCGDSQ